MLTNEGFNLKKKRFRTKKGFNENLEFQKSLFLNKEKID